MVFPYTDDKEATEEEKLSNIESPIRLQRRTERMMDPFADEIREQKGLKRSDGIKYDELIQYIIVKAGGKLI